MEIYLIRHTTPLLSPGLIYGKMEVELTDTFEEELAIVRQKLPKFFDAVYSSPSLRCTQLAKRIEKDFISDFRLMELNFGDWEGKTWDTVDQTSLQLWMDDYVNVCVPGGESMLEMQSRINDFWKELTQQPYSRIAIVTHGGVIRILLSKVRSIALDKIFEIKVAYGEVFLININRIV